jgi:regulator of protease activity HflC (stomatin/prohibitin superfamily)
MSPVILFCLAAVLFVALMLVFASVKIVPEYERGVVFRLGRLVGARGPGLFLLIPVVERMVRVDTRVITLDVPAQEVITLDNVTIKVNAVLYFMVVNPDWAIVKVMDYIRATLQIAQTTLRSGVGQVDLDTLLARREQLNERLQKIIDEQTESSCRRACSGRWPSRPRPSARSAPRSFTRRASSKHRRCWRWPPM